MSFAAGFNPDFVSKHLAPEASRDGSTPFPMEEVIRRLDGEAEPEENQPEDSTEMDFAQTMRRLLEWIGTFDAHDPRGIAFVGKRAIAAVWVVNPAIFDNASAFEVANKFQISPAKFKTITAEFSRQFKVRNVFQTAHGWQNPVHRSSSTPQPEDKSNESPPT
jgi:hypothetical protein